LCRHTHRSTRTLTTKESAARRSNEICFRFASLLKNLGKKRGITLLRASEPPTLASQLSSGLCRDCEKVRDQHPLIFLATGPYNWLLSMTRQP